MNVDNSHSSLSLPVCSVLLSDLQYYASPVPHDIQEPAEKRVLFIQENKCACDNI